MRLGDFERDGPERYLQPEPVLQNPEVVKKVMRTGVSLPTYSYAANNPVSATDETGTIVSFDVDRNDYWERLVDVKLKLSSCPAVKEWFQRCFGEDPFISPTDYTFEYHRGE